ncbi:DUF4337 domain-containing protein [Vogesella oryzae]|uniref:DUF4337 domain-containing protein n=1 Tax=Vogesella oryzae TaxID=1735285 RepID=UPI00158349D3|nr:DUF4337 domain-containing protein [Vogesella oryzae]
MEVELSVEGRQRRINTAVAMTVVLLSVFMGIAKIKDDNLVQAMQLAKSDAVDLWSEYQSRSIKKSLAESTLQQLEIAGASNPALVASLARQRNELQQKIAAYNQAIPATAAKAKDREAEYNRLNFHDDQFDLSDAAISIGIACAAVAALVDMWLPLVVAWAFGTFGAVFGMAGFFGWMLHPDWLMSLLS